VFGGRGIPNFNGREKKHARVNTQTQPGKGICDRMGRRLVEIRGRGVSKLEKLQTPPPPYNGQEPTQEEGPILEVTDGGV